MKAFKLSDVVKAGSKSNHSSSYVGYAWHKRGKEGERAKNALAFYFKEEALLSIRYREGDNMDLSIMNDVATFEFGPQMEFSVYGHAVNSKSKMSKCSVSGIEIMKKYLPEAEGVIELYVIETSIGKIVVKLPSQTIITQ